MMSAQGGGGGYSAKADAVRKLSKGCCVKMQTGGGGSKNQKTVWTSFMDDPHCYSCMTSMISFLSYSVCLVTVIQIKGMMKVVAFSRSLKRIDIVQYMDAIVKSWPVK